jgi:hypothetical protein
MSLAFSSFIEHFYDFTQNPYHQSLEYDQESYAVEIFDSIFF